MKELIARALAGDRQAERQLFERLTVRFRYIAKRYIKDDDAEDIVQDACVTIIEKYKTQQYSSGFEAWAYGVLKMKIGNYLQKLKTVRKNIVDRQAMDSQAAAVSSHEGIELKRMLIRCLKKIYNTHPHYARVLNLAHQGYSTDEICGMLQIKPNYMYVILNRGRKMLKKCLENDEV